MYLMVERNVQVNVTEEIRERIKELKGADSYTQYFARILKEKQQ